MHEQLEFKNFDLQQSWELNSGENTSDFKVTRFFINQSKHDIIVIGRNNLPVTIMSFQNASWQVDGKRYDTNKFKIRTSYFFKTTETITRTIRNIDEYKKYFGNKQPELEIIREALHKKLIDDYLCTNVYINIDYDIDLFDLKIHKRIYNPQTDLLLHFEAYALDCPHPFSIEGQGILDYHNTIASTKTSGVLVELIDNENNIKNRYMYVAKQLIELPVRKDANRLSGVYLSIVENDALDDVHINPRYSTFAEAEAQFGIHKTKEEALSGGNPEHISKAYVLSLEKDLSESKAEFERLKIQNQRDKEFYATKASERTDKTEELKFAIDEQLNAAKAEVEKLKLEGQRQKELFEEKARRRDDYYEHRSYTRKDTHELIKYIPALILGALGAFAVMKNKS